MAVLQCVAIVGSFLQLPTASYSLQCLVDLGALTRKDTFLSTMRTRCFVLLNTMCEACENLGWEMSALSQCAWNAARLTQNKLRKVTGSSIYLVYPGFILLWIVVLFWGCEEEGHCWSRNSAWNWHSLLTARYSLRCNTVYRAFELSCLPGCATGTSCLGQKASSVHFPDCFKFDFQLDH